MGQKMWASKTVVLLFTRSSKDRNKYEGKKVVKMDGIQILFSDSVNNTSNTRQ